MEDKKDSRHIEPRYMVLDEFLHSYNASDIALVSQTPNKMLRDIGVFEYLDCDPGRMAISESNVWLNSGNSSSTLHEDDDDNINCLLAGEKEWYFLSDEAASSSAGRPHAGDPPAEGPAGEDQLDMIDPQLSSTFSAADMDSLSASQDAGILAMPFSRSLLRAGDCVFVPRRQLHFVRSHGRNLAVTTLFDGALALHASGADSWLRSALFPLQERPALPSCLAPIVPGFAQ